MKGCSLELSTGRQTKIEAITSAPSPLNESIGNSASKTPCAASDGSRFPPRLPNMRFVPRRASPLALINTRDRSCEGRSRLDGSNFYGSHHGKGGSKRRAVDGGEVDFVGCLFAVTMELAASTFGHGEVMLATGSSAPACPPDGGGCGRDTAVAGGSSGSPSGAQAVAGVAGSAEEVTYRVHFTDPAGACVRVEKRVRSNLARHHRILRSAPGTCWAVMNAACSTAEVSSARERALPTMGEYGTRGTGRLGWSSMTAVGGNGSGTPPRTLGGAPTEHLSLGLLKLRRWAEGVEGKNAVRRERQRLAIFLARERQAGGELLGSEAMATPAVGVSLMSSKPGDDGQELCRPLPKQGHESLRTTTVIGYVSSFGLGAAFLTRVLGVGNCLEKARRANAVGDAIPPSADTPQAETGQGVALPWLRVDTGERLLTLQLTMEALKQLFRAALDISKRRPSTVSSEEPTQPEQPVDGVAVTRVPTDADTLLLLARAVLDRGKARDAAGSLDDQGERKESVAANDPDLAAQGHTSAPHVPPASSMSSNTPETCSVRTSYVAVVGEAGHGGGSVTKGDTIDELAAAIVRIARQQCVSDESGSSSVGACTTAAGETKLGDGALPSKTEQPASARSPRASRDESKTPDEEHGEGGRTTLADSVSVALPAFLARLAEACGGKQHAFSVRMLSAKVSGRGIGVVEKLEVLETTGRARDLLERLACCVRP